MHKVLIDIAPSVAIDSSDELLDIWEASEVRDAQGTRRFGSACTIRRRLKDGSLPHMRIGNKYYIRRSALELLPDRMNRTASASTRIGELEVAVNRVLASAVALTDEQCARIGARLRGAKA